MVTSAVDPAGVAPAPEAQDAKRARLAWEAGRVEQGLASARVGRVVSQEAFGAWTDSWGTRHELPKPRIGT